MTNEFDIIDHPVFLSWLKEYAKTEPLGISFLTQGNTKLFHKMWGKPEGRTQRFDYWKREYLGIIIYVYSDEESTYYKVQYLGEKSTFIADRKIGSYLSGFFNKMIKDIIND